MSDATSLAESTTESGPVGCLRRSTFVFVLDRALGVGAPTVSATGGGVGGGTPNTCAGRGRVEIGREGWRGRGEISVGAGLFKKKKKKEGVRHAVVGVHVRCRDLGVRRRGGVVCVAVWVVGVGGDGRGGVGAKVPDLDVVWCVEQ